MYDPYWSLQPLAIAGILPVGRWGDVDARQMHRHRPGAALRRPAHQQLLPRLAGPDQGGLPLCRLPRRSGRFYWPVSFLGIHLFPTIMVFLGCLPLYAVARSGGRRRSAGWTSSPRSSPSRRSCIGLRRRRAMRVFRRDPANRGRCIRTGLWARSRHPNYLGEIMTWWGLWLFALAAGPGWWWTVAGAAAITVMFVFVSVPMMEKRALATREGYRQYRDAAPRCSFPAGAPRRRRRTAPTEPADAGRVSPAA